jgi:hypothetical protein
VGDFLALSIRDAAVDKIAGSESNSLWHVGGVLEGSSLEKVGSNKVARLWRTRDFGQEFTIVDIPGTYDFIQTVAQNGRLLHFGFRKKKSTDPAGTQEFFLRVGKQNTDGTYTWSGEKPVALPAAIGTPRCGDFQPVVRPDGVVELFFLSSSPPCGARLVRSHRIDMDATNEWVG